MEWQIRYAIFGPRESNEGERYLCEVFAYKDHQEFLLARSRMPNIKSAQKAALATALGEVAEISKALEEAKAAL